MEREIWREREGEWEGRETGGERLEREARERGQMGPETPEIQIGS